MKVVFRVDASTHIGTGHIIRCITLAESLREKNIQVSFICRDHPGNLIKLLHQKDFLVCVLTSEKKNSFDFEEGNAGSLGASIEEDVSQTIDALNGFIPDLLILDHYAISNKWEFLMRPYTKKIMAIDDLANRSHDCDILLDQNLCKDEKNRYRNLVPQDCRTLIGPNYALLHPKYAKYASKLTRNNNQIKKIFIFFGGSDPDNMTLLTLQALSCLELRDIDLDIVIGANNPFRSSIEYYANQRMRTKIYGELPHLAELMSEADMAIGAGGTTALERMVLGLPSLVITIAENQVPVSKLLNEIGAIRLVGNSKNVDIETIKTVTYDEITSKGYLNLSKKSRTLCDGNGVFRVRDEIIKLYS